MLSKSLCPSDLRACAVGSKGTGSFQRKTTWFTKHITMLHNLHNLQVCTFLMPGHDHAIHYCLRVLHISNSIHFMFQWLLTYQSRTKYMVSWELPIIRITSHLILAHTVTVSYSLSLSCYENVIVIIRIYIIQKNRQPPYPGSYWCRVQQQSSLLPIPPVLLPLCFRNPSSGRDCHDIEDDECDGDFRCLDISLYHEACGASTVFLARHLMMMTVAAMMMIHE